MKKVSVTIKHTYYVQDDLKVETTSSKNIKCINWKGKHYKAGITWEVANSEEEIRTSNRRIKQLKLNKIPILTEEYGSHWTSIDYNTFEEKIKTDWVNLPPELDHTYDEDYLIEDI